MQPGARLQAAVEVLSQVFRGRSASIVLADWGRSHRFAGSADRSWIGNLVYDCLRRKQSLAYAMKVDTPRAIVLGALRYSWNLPLTEISSACTGEGFDAAPISPEEEKGLSGADISNAPPWVQGDYPEWLHHSFQRCFGENAIAEGRALSVRAPIDLRVNTLKATRTKLLKAFARHGAVTTPYSPIGIRLPIGEGGARAPNVEAEPAHGRGWFEVQDEGSQIASFLAGPEPRMQVADICAGAGGKTLAMAALMQNTGQIYAYDADPQRLRPIFERLRRSGARNVQTLPPGQPESLAALIGRMDLVLVDAPCSGSGTWRRRPDSKWRLSSSQLAERTATQPALLAKGALLLRPGGTLAYVTCSVLPEENEDQVAAFLEQNPRYSPADVTEYAKKILSNSPTDARSYRAAGLLLTPACHGTDGFYIAVLRKNDG